MRPVERGAWPTKNGERVKFKKYSRARGDLVDRMGQFCSYCEQMLPASVAVEHVQPKALEPGLEKDWENFLLACTNCNSTKGDKEVDLNQFVWPDKDYTYLYFSYSADGKVRVKSGLSSREKEKAEALIKLVGLQKRPPKVGTVAYQEASDRRWVNRKAEWAIAETVKKDDYLVLKEVFPERALNTLAVAAGKGFWSVWYTVFKDLPEVRKRLIEQYKGTCAGCFDSSGRPVERN